MQSKMIMMLAGMSVVFSLNVSQAQQAAKKSVADITLALNGKTNYVIALAADAIPAERTAARELSEHLEKISGAKFAIKPEGTVKAEQSQILVGAGPRAKKLLPTQNWKSLGTEGIVIKTVGKNLVLAGGRPRGSLYAVYSFLEDSLGVRWWTPTESTIPVQKNLRIPAQKISYVPKLQIREAHYDDYQLSYNPAFPTRHKINGHFQHQTEEWGGHNSILGFVHTFDVLLPPEKYFKDHPEWYSDPDNGGKPCTPASRMPAPQQSQLCLTNEEARRELTKNALELIRKDPSAGMISISQNDNENKYNGPKDLEIEAREGSPAGPLLEFVNAVAADIEKEFPGFLVETLAYQYSRKAPKTVRPRKNVVIRLCSIEADFFRPLDSAANADFRDDMIAWKKIAPRLYVWDYLTNFKNAFMIHPNRPVLASNIRFFANNNAIALFEQGDSYTHGTGDFVALRIWTLSQLMWNPDLDQRKVEDEFLNGYYGAAAPHLRAYFNTIESAFEKSGKKLSTFNEDHSYLTLDVMNAATRNFRDAAAAVAGNDILSTRVRYARLSFDHAWILFHDALKLEARNSGKPFEGPAELGPFIMDFVDSSHAAGLGKNGKYTVMAPYIDTLVNRAKALMLPPATLPELARGVRKDDLIDAQLRDLLFYNIGTVVSWENDAASSSGKAAKMIGNSDAWAVQYHFKQSDEFLQQGVWHCYAYVRATANEGAAPGPAVKIGLYDVKNKKEVVTIGKTLAEVGGKAYKLVDLGKHKLHSQMYLYAAPPLRTDIEGVYVDRFLLVREAE